MTLNHDISGPPPFNNCIFRLILFSSIRSIIQTRTPVIKGGCIINIIFLKPIPSSLKKKKKNDMAMRGGWNTFKGIMSTGYMHN